MYTWFHSVSSLLLPVLAGLFRFTQDWGLAVIALTSLVKTGLFYFNLLAARQQIRSIQAQPRLKELRERHGSDPEKLVAETMKVNREHGISPLLPFGVLLAQMPVLAGMYGLFLTHGSMMTSILIPWVANLAEWDPYHLVPAVTALFSFLTALVPLTAEAAAPVPGGGANRTLMALLAGLIPLAFMWRSPAALGLYWLTGTVFSLAERGFYRTGWGRRSLLRR
ncbi:YidC/Oxa1 family membrane protein insertase [Paenibacillus sp. P26]|nr:YidC/Oxa1 family membrane protein insertase [Paenibacillus sp. P26]